MESSEWGPELEREERELLRRIAVLDYWRLLFSMLNPDKRRDLPSLQ